MPAVLKSPTTGSSPRVWGTCGYEAAIARLARFIPTCVGNMPENKQEYTMLAVHPHVCGEHDHLAVDVRHPLRFIPTCVGNMPFIRIDDDGFTVHPHVCGEHAELRNETDNGVGSSPRVWGTSVRAPARI